jgi:hypothetical protein
MDASVTEAWDRFDELTRQIAACADDQRTYWLATEILSRDCLASSTALQTSLEAGRGYRI